MRAEGDAPTPLSRVAACGDGWSQRPRVEERHVEALEREMDAWNESLPELRSFILPGGGWVDTYLHLARTVCRRAERLVVRLSHQPGEHVSEPLLVYLNRLSDAMFVWSRWASHQLGVPETLWEPNKAASGSAPE